MKFINLKSLKSLFLKNILEFIVIVLGITFSFYLDDTRKSEDLKTLSTDLKQNLLDEIYEIEEYMIEREEVFMGDGTLLVALNDKSVTYDSLYFLSNRVQ